MQYLNKKICSGALRYNTVLLGFQCDTITLSRYLMKGQFFDVVKNVLAPREIYKTFSFHLRQSNIE